MLFECKYCNYTTKLSANFTRHNSSKKHLKNVNKQQKNILIEHESVHSAQKSVKSAQKSVHSAQKSVHSIQKSVMNNKFLENDENSPKINNKLDEIIEIIKDGKTKYKCNFCNKEFSQTCNLYRHRKICKNKTISDLNKNKENNIFKQVDINNSEINNENIQNKQIELLLSYLQQDKEEQRKREDLLLKALLENKEKEKNPVSEGNSNITQLKEELEELRKIVNQQKLQNLNQTHNLDQSTHYTKTNSGTYFEATNQNNLLNNLNLNYNNVISMDKFIYNMEYVNKIPKSDLEAIAYASENMTEGDLADTIHKTLEKNCLEQTKGVINPADGLELLPVIPVVCSDGNCRSHKEKVNKFWETVYGDKHFDQMLNVIDKRLYEVLKKKIYLEEYGKKKLFKKIKRKYTIHDMKKFQEKINGSIGEKPFKQISI